MSIEVSSLSFAYREHEVLRDVSFSAADGELVSVLGANGAGKSTLFRCILGLLRCYRGTVRINGRDARTLSARELAQQTAYIPQSHAPAFDYSVADMVLMGTTARLSPMGTPSKAERTAVMRALERVGIAPLAEKDYLYLSGGEQQLVLIARALVQGSRLLLLDEPTANLDYGNVLRVNEIIRSLVREGYTVLQSTHSPEQAYLYSDKLVALKDGTVAAVGTPQEVITAENLRTLYGAEVRVESLCNDRARVAVPLFLDGG